MPSTFSPYDRSQCLVCKIELGEDDFHCDHQGIHYVFCSQQCKDRFIAHPSLYCGNPQGGISEKQKGRQEIKRHKIHYISPLTDAARYAVEDCVKRMVGVQFVKSTPQTLTVTYDLMEVSLRDIEQAIESEIGKVAVSFLENLKRGWIHYSEECELDNLSHPSRL